MRALCANLATVILVLVGIIGLGVSTAGAWRAPDLR